MIQTVTAREPAPAKQDSMSKTILVVDDEERLTSLLEAYLQQEGFRVVTAGNGLEALEVIRRDPPDLIVLDIMMPEMDGVEFLRVLRTQHSTPVILLTARVGDEDKIIGLELGADDYLTKPFRPRELLARVRAVLRRAGRSGPEPAVLHSGDLTLDRARHEILLDGHPIDLTPTEFEILAALMAAPGKVFTRMELLERAQGVGYEGYERTIDAHIKNLRAKIDPGAQDTQRIQTVYGIGYRLARE
jgi:two-component system, OmpR family, alkaline phosphatase synthesis response regulator PhoP